MPLTCAYGSQSWHTCPITCIAIRNLCWYELNYKNKSNDHSAHMLDCHYSTNTVLFIFLFKNHRMSYSTESWALFHETCQSLTTVISYWNPCIWLAESEFVSEKHWQNTWWNAPLNLELPRPISSRVLWRMWRSSLSSWICLQSASGCGSS